MVPAANRSSLLKSRELSGRLDTSFRDRRSPPLPSETGAFCSCTRTRAVSDFGSCNVVVRVTASATTRDCADLYVIPSVTTETPYFAGAMAVNAPSPNLRLRGISGLTGNVGKDNGGSNHRASRIVTKNAGPGGSRSRREGPTARQRHTANMSALTRKRCEACLLTTDATDLFEGVILISPGSVNFEIGVAQSFWTRGREGRHRFRSCRDAPRDVHARKALLTSENTAAQQGTVA